MKKIFLSIIILTGLNFVSRGQGTVRGKITDATGETLIGVPVVLKAKPSVGTVTDFDGNYSIKITDSTEQTLVISYVGYQSIEQTFHPRNGEVIVRNFVMKSSAQEIKEVEVTGKAVRAGEYYTEAIKKNSSVSIDYISSETIRKTGDATVTAAVARVTGVSTNGAFITVRGIGDRYVKTSINGSRIPTLDPFTNNIRLDLFAASLVDNVIITKTASPDLPGDFAGAYISVETKDYPEQLTLSFEGSLAYNGNTSFQDVLTSERSSTDWLGYDHSLRDRNHDNYVATVPTPTQYQEFVALGLGPYFNELGVNGTSWDASDATRQLYKRLGYVQLGLLAPAQINDDAAAANADALYISGNYSSQAFKTINADVPAYGKSFPNNWNTFYANGPLNYSHGLSLGNQTKFFGKPLGFMVGYRYGSLMQYDPEATSNRAGVDGNGIPTIPSIIQEQTSRESNGWSGLVNLAYKFSTNHSVSLLFMPNFTGTNKVRYAYDYADPLQVVITQSQFYEQRKQLIYQFKSEHYIPGPKLKGELNASYTDGYSSAPDFKNLVYVLDPQFNTYQIGEGVKEGIHRYYRYLDENIFDSRASLEMPVNEKPEKPRKVKVGAAYQRTDRKYDQYEYFIRLGPNKPALTNNDINSYLSPDQFNITTFTDTNGLEHSSINAYYDRNETAVNHTFGNSDIKAGFATVDYFFTSRLRLSGGLRVEQANIFTDVYKYDSLGLPANDFRRLYQSGLPASNPGKLDEISYLPSVNAMYKIRPDESAPINLRANYSKTVARPSIRELSDVGVYDYEYRAIVYGNSNLKMVQIDNYDLRLESYFKSGDNVSVSAFYKDFKNHIELINAIGITWQNVADNSRVYGVEVEGKKVLTKNFDLRANVTLVNSTTTYVRTEVQGGGVTLVYIPLDTVQRTMFGQAPYVVNGIFTYTNDTLGLTAAVSYNVQGPRLVLTSSHKDIPDVYELPRHLIDAKVTKKLGKHFVVGLTVRDLLSAPVRRAYKYPEGYTLDYDKYTYGSIYSFNLTYKL